MSHQQPPDVTVCIVTNGRHDALAACLVSLIDQPDLPAFEVLVAANNCPATATIVREFLPAARVAELPTDSVGTARNALAGLASAPLLLFLDDDARLPHGYIERVVAVADSHPEWTAFGGPNVSDPTSPPTERAQGIALASWIGGGPFRLRYDLQRTVHRAGVRHLTSCNLVVRAAAFRLFPSFPIGAGEDNVAIALLAQTGTLGSHPRLAVFHARRPTLSEFVRQSHKYGRGRVFASRAAGTASSAPRVAAVSALVTVAAAVVFAPSVAVGAVVAYITAVTITSLRRSVPARLVGLAVIGLHLGYLTGLLRQALVGTRRGTSPDSTAHLRTTSR